MRRILVLGNCQNLIPFLTKLVQHFDDHVWFGVEQRLDMKLINDEKINLLLIDNSLKEFATNVLNKMQSGKLLQDIQMIMYDPQMKEPATISNIDRAPLSYDATQFESLVNELRGEGHDCMIF